MFQSWGFGGIMWQHVMLTLYDNPFSPFARKVRMVLRFKGLEFESIDALALNEHDGLVEVNPRAEVRPRRRRFHGHRFDRHRLLPGGPIPDAGCPSCGARDPLQSATMATGCRHSSRCDHPRHLHLDVAYARTARRASRRVAPGGAWRPTQGCHPAGGFPRCRRFRVR